MMTSPFDALVVRLNQTQRNQEWKGKQVYSYDPRIAEAVPYQHTLFGLIPLFKGEGIRYYRVAPQETVICPPIEVIIKDSSNKQRLIEVVLVIQRLNPERVGDFVAALAGHDGDPFEIFTSLVGGWIQNFVIQKRAAKIDTFTRFSPGMEGAAAARQECVQYCVANAEKLFGMYLTCEIRLPEADLIIDPISLLFIVFTKDCEEELSVRIDLTILPPDSEERRDLALQRMVSTERIHETVKKLTGQWFREHCTLEKFCYRSADVRVALEPTIRSYIEKELYRELINFRITCSAPFDKDFQIREDYDVTCEVEPGPTLVPVRHKVLLERNDIARLRSESIGNLEQWVEKTLTRHTRAVFFDKKYVDVVVDFEPIQKEIKDRVIIDVERIGFKVAHLMTMPTDEQMRSCLDGVLSFETEVLSFKTKDSRVEFKLSVAARVKLDDLKRVRAFLRPGDYLREQFKRATREEAGLIVRQLAPESLYTKFRENLADDAIQHGKDNTPESMIKDAISQRLMTEFGAKLEDLTLTEEPTELTELFSAIRPPKNQHINVVTEARGDLGERLSFQFDYRIVSISRDGGWPRFEEITHNCQATDVDGKALEITEAITEMLGHAAAERLEGLPPDLLRSPNYDVAKSIQGHALNDALTKVAHHFGLEVEILSRTRELSDWERKARERTQQDYNAKISRLVTLQEEYSNANSGYLAEDDPHLQEIKAKIASCEEELSRFNTGHDAYFLGSGKTIPQTNWKRLLQLTDDKP